MELIRFKLDVNIIFQSCSGEVEMKRSWIPLFLIPCLAFAAYPIYETDSIEEAVSEDSIAAREVHDQRVATESGSSESVSLEQRRQELKAKATAASSGRKASGAHLRRSSMRRNSSHQDEGESRTSVQESRQHSNRPKVTYRDAEKKGTAEEIEADAMGDQANAAAENPQKSTSGQGKRGSVVSQKKSSLSSQNNEKGKSTLKRKSAQYSKKYQKKSNHPGNRPAAEMAQ